MEAFESAHEGQGSQGLSEGVNGVEPGCGAVVLLDELGVEWCAVGIPWVNHHNLSALPERKPITL